MSGRRAPPAVLADPTCPREGAFFLEDWEAEKLLDRLESQVNDDTD